jgi:hypothetical protein
VCGISASDLIALAALIFSITALYLTAVRRGRIEIIHVASEDDLYTAASSERPVSPDVAVEPAVFVFKSGNRSGRA